MASSEEITRLLEMGDRESLEELMPLVYDELRKLARALFRRERVNHTLQPTALVHEAYLRLISENSNITWQNRAHFFGIAANSMRQVLVNYAKARHRQKRGRRETLVSFDDSVGFSLAPDIDVLVLDEALEVLAQLDRRQAKIVELRFFGGLSLDETAAILDISTATVGREWRMARTWLYRQLRIGL